MAGCGDVRWLGCARDRCAAHQNHDQHEAEQGRDDTRASPEQTSNSHGAELMPASVMAVAQDRRRAAEPTPADG